MRTFEKAALLAPVFVGVRLWRHRVVTEGVQRAYPGAKVEPQRTELKSAAADQSDGAKTSVPNPTPK